MINNSMKKYIREQKDILTKILSNRESVDSITLQNIHHITIAASGTSRNAALVVKSALSQANIQIDIDTPFQLQNYSRLLEISDLVIAVSHTGKSQGTLSCAQIAHNHHIPVIGVTGYMDSPLTHKCDMCIDIQCGDEPIGPKTKGYTATCLTLYLIILQILANNQDQTYTQSQFIQEWTQEIAKFDQTIQQTEDYLSHHHEWAQATCISVIGYGIHYGTACEGNLKLLETMQIPAMCYELEEFMHGAHRTIHQNSYLIFIHTHGIGYDLMTKLIQFAKEQKAHILIIDDTDKKIADITIPYLPLTKASFNASLVLQVMASILPEYKGINPSDPVLKDFAFNVGTRVK